jgi:hypothetical protein
MKTKETVLTMNDVRQTATPPPPPTTTTTTDENLIQHFS